MHEQVIVADIYESRSGVPQQLIEIGATVEMRRLPVGDYLIGPVLVERKCFWPQVARLRRSQPFPYLLLEGEDLDDGPLGARAVRGAWLALAELGVRVVHSSNARDSAEWLRLLATRSARRRHFTPAYTRRAKLRQLAPEAMLAAVPGISVTTARALLIRFGTVESVIAAGPDGWLSVPGVGRSRAAALERAFRQPHRRS